MSAGRNGSSFDTAQPVDSGVAAQLTRSAESGSARRTLPGSVIAFLGIPYTALSRERLALAGAPATRELHRIRDASSFGSVCPQVRRGRVIGSEDCLVLDVFLAQGLPGARQPVMVLFHGGGTRRVDTQQPPFDAPLEPVRVLPA